MRPVQHIKSSPDMSQLLGQTNKLTNEQTKTRDCQTGLSNGTHCTHRLIMYFGSSQLFCCKVEMWGGRWTVAGSGREPCREPKHAPYPASPSKSVQSPRGTLLTWQRSSWSPGTHARACCPGTGGLQKDTPAGIEASPTERA